MQEHLKEFFVAVLSGCIVEVFAKFVIEWVKRLSNRYLEHKTKRRAKKKHRH
jgi:antibiotic biosynthesis monooxygenase (ABM) superfamily enzyme